MNLRLNFCIKFDVVCLKFQLVLTIELIKLFTFVRPSKEIFSLLVLYLSHSYFARSLN